MYRLSEKRNILLVAVAFALILVLFFASYQIFGVTKSNFDQESMPISSFSLVSFKNGLNIIPNQPNVTIDNNTIGVSSQHLVNSSTLDSNTSITTNSKPISTSAPSSTGSAIATSVGLQAYLNSACTNPVGDVNWGLIPPGGTATTTIYVKNTGNSSPLTLNITAENWSPATAKQYLTVSCDKQNFTLAQGQFTSLTLKLTVSASITGISFFNVQVLISGTV